MGYEIIKQMGNFTVKRFVHVAIIQAIFGNGL